jgi:MULE transposase domain
MVGITNTCRTLPVSQSFARSEAAVSFDFIFECHKDYIFSGEIPSPRVVLSDQAPGMISSLPNHLPTAILQFCDWHVSQNIKARLLEGGYTKDLREQIVQQFWRYCKAETAEEVTKQRFELTALLNQKDTEYILRTWVPKETQFLRLYTKQYLNLDCFSNQRCESLHPIIKDILNPQLRLAETINRLGTTIQQKLSSLRNEETETGLKLPRTLDKRAFTHLIGTTSTYAVELIASE